MRQHIEAGAQPKAGELLHDAAPPPDSVQWVALLKWAIGALPIDHRDLAFLASLLSQAINRPGLTELQAKYASRIVDRLLAEWSERLPYTAADVDLRAIASVGEA